MRNGGRNQRCVARRKKGRAYSGRLQKPGARSRWQRKIEGGRLGLNVSDIFYIIRTVLKSENRLP